MKRSKYNRRTRKRLRLGEFRQYGFGVILKIREGEPKNDITDELIEIFEQNGFCFGGGGIGADVMELFVMNIGRKNRMTADRADEFLEKLKGMSFVEDLARTGLVDAWHYSKIEMSDYEGFMDEQLKKWKDADSK